MKQNPLYQILYSFIKNLLFFVVLFLTFNLLKLSRFGVDSLHAVIPFILGYEAIYFINSYGDRIYDLEYHGLNLYHQIKNEYLYWSCFALFVLSGIILSWKISPTAVFGLVVIYIISAIYSLPPIRLKDRFLVRFITMGFAYGFKTIYCLNLLGLELNEIPVSLIILVMTFASFFTIIYKGTNLIYKKKNSVKITEIALLAIFLAITLAVFSVKSYLVWKFALALILYTVVLSLIRWTMGRLGFL